MDYSKDVIYCKSFGKGHENNKALILTIESPDESPFKVLQDDHKLRLYFCIKGTTQSTPVPALNIFNGLSLLRQANIAGDASFLLQPCSHYNVTAVQRAKRLLKKLFKAFNGKCRVQYQTIVLIVLYYTSGYHVVSKRPNRKTREALLYYHMPSIIYHCSGRSPSQEPDAALFSYVYIVVLLSNYNNATCPYLEGVGKKAKCYSGDAVSSVLAMGSGDSRSGFRC